MESAIGRPNGVPAIIKFNVGGQVFATSWTTISSRGDNLLTSLVQKHYSGDFRSEVLDGALFIDRDGAAFTHVLQVLRGGGLHWGGQITRTWLREELAFFAVTLDPEEVEQLADESAATKLFKQTCEFGVFAETKRFVQTVWPALKTYLKTRAALGDSMATLQIKRNQLPNKEVAYVVVQIDVEFISKVDFNTPLHLQDGGNGWSMIRYWFENMTRIRCSFEHRATLEWDLVWSLDGKRDYTLNDVFLLLGHAIKRREVCEIGLVDVKNCSCFVSAQEMKWE